MSAPGSSGIDSLDDELVVQVEKAGQTFLNNVDLPWPEDRPGSYKFRSADHFWYRLRRMVNNRLRSGRTWPHKVRHRAHQANATAGPDETPYARLSRRLYEVVAKQIERELEDTDE